MPCPPCAVLRRIVVETSEVELAGIVERARSEIDEETGPVRDGRIGRQGIQIISEEPVLVRNRMGVRLIRTANSCRG